MTRFYLVRHGQTEWNRVERFRGRADVPLNEIGVAQARFVASRLGGEAISAVFSSPLSRAQKTAEPIAQWRGISVQMDDGLIDIDYGEWQGLSPEDVAGDYPKLHAQWVEHPESVRIPGGESLDDVRARVAPLVDALAVRFEGRQVALVSHKVVCKVLLCIALNMDNSHFWRVDQDNGAISVFEWESGRGFVVSSINDACHLRGAQGS